MVQRFVLTVAMVAFSGLGAAMAEENAWYPSKWGEGDEIGSANVMTPESVVAASKLVKEGKVYALGIETNSSTPAFPPRGFKIYIVQPDQIGGQTMGPTKSVYNDDIVEGWFGVGSQIDGLGHMGIDNIYYNGFDAKEFAKFDGLTKLGIEKIPPFVARGVLLDMAAYFGKDRLEGGTAYNKAEIEGAAKAQGIELREGDVVLFHSGWMTLLDEDPAAFAASEPGLGKEGAEHLAEIGVLAVGADTFALEVLPHEEGAGAFEVHQTLLARNGIYILENMDTRELAADKAHEFMFVLGPARITGAVQMIINPVAIR